MEEVTGTVAQAGCPTLEDVNAHLLARLDALIVDASPEELLDIANALAKLNASSRNNDLVAARTEDDNKNDQALFAHLSER